PQRDNISFPTRRSSDLKQVEKYKQEKSTFVFTKDGEFFQREVDGKLNLVSVYYLEYGKSNEDITDVATIIGKRNKVRRAETGSQDRKSTRLNSSHLVIS